MFNKWGKGLPDIVLDGPRDRNTKQSFRNSTTSKQASDAGVVWTD